MKFLRKVFFIFTLLFNLFNDFLFTTILNSDKQTDLNTSEYVFIKEFSKINVDLPWKLEKKRDFCIRSFWKRKIPYRVYNATGFFGGVIFVSTPNEGGPFGVTNIYDGEYLKYHEGEHIFPAKFVIETKKGIWELKVHHIDGRVEIRIDKSNLLLKNSITVAGCKIKNISKIG